MKHLVAGLLHVLMTYRADVSFFIAGARLASCERKMYQEFVFFPLLQKSKTRDRRLENK